MARRSSQAQRLRLQPADPFDLIRWLARSQSDPRKALAELVQNSIDANARIVRVDRRRLRGTPAVVVRDDGEGVLPAMARDEALRFLATNIGHSHKRGLSPQQRHAEVVAGKYGVGLLGFWAMGRRMEIRSRVAGSPLVILRLTEDEPRVEIEPVAPPIGAPDTFTEVVVLELHEAAARALGGRRITDYLAAELRGPILSTGVQVEVHDGMARGLAQKRFVVAPHRYTGEPLALPAEIAVEGHPPVRVEIYLGRGDERPAVQVACAGTLVADDIAELASLALAEPPWVGRSLTGLIDFAGFNVPPGTRRGVVPDSAAAAFVHALDRLRPSVEAELARLDRERRAVVDRQMLQDLRRALRGFRNRLPHYELPAVAAGRAEPDLPRAAPDGVPLDGGERGAAPADAGTDEASGAGGRQADLFPPGPLAAVRIAPARVEIAPGAERRVSARGVDGQGRAVAGALAFVWSVEGAGFAVRGEGPRPAIAADPDLRTGAEAVLLARAIADGREAEGRATLVAVAPEDRAPDPGLGIPEPELVDEPAASWRSRWSGDRWQVNAAHEDYVALRGDARGRFRYHLALLAKEIVNRSYGAPGSDTLLERMAEVLAHAERNLRGA